MEKEQANLFITANAKYFNSGDIPMIREKLERADEVTFAQIQSCDFKDPTTVLIVSIFLGELGIDRFMIGDTGMGILKLLTFGCCGILAIYDWFTIMKKTKKVNLAKLSEII